MSTWNCAVVASSTRCGHYNTMASVPTCNVKWFLFYCDGGSSHARCHAWMIAISITMPQCHAQCVLGSGLILAAYNLACIVYKTENTRGDSCAMTGCINAQCNVHTTHVVFKWCISQSACDCRQGQGDAFSDASKGFWLDMMKACSMRGDAGQPGLQMAAERLISVHLAYAEELMATSRREHARAEAEALEAQKVSALTPSLSLHMLFFFLFVL